MMDAGATVEMILKHLMYGVSGGVAEKTANCRDILTSTLLRVGEGRRGPRGWGLGGDHCFPAKL